ncbi:MAG: DsrE family protein [Limisphaerales bacterium]
MKKSIAAAVMTIALGVGGVFLSAQPAQTPSVTEEQNKESKLAVIWTSGDADVAHRVCFMYCHNAKKQKWFDQVVLVVWGPSARLLAGDKDLQAKVKSMMQDGVQVQACVACADSYGVSDRLREMRIEVKGMGPPLTEMLKSGWKVLTF